LRNLGDAALTPPEAEQFLRFEKLRRQIDHEARVFVLRLVLAIAIAFALGWALGRWR
jgi:hypothetical protein